MRITQQQFHVAGLALRTNNREATDTVPQHWAAFAEADVAAKLGATGDTYAVYTDHEHAGVDNRGDYTLVIGYRVPEGAAVPDGLVKVAVPASEREAIVLEPGRRDLVAQAWQRIWERDDLDLSYLADVERYGQDGTIEISLGLRSAP